jgi:hypothetical protein
VKVHELTPTMPGKARFKSSHGFDVLGIGLHASTFKPAIAITRLRLDHEGGIKACGSRTMMLCGFTWGRSTKRGNTTRCSDLRVIQSKHRPSMLHLRRVEGGERGPTRPTSVLLVKIAKTPGLSFDPPKDAPRHPRGP